ncbi:Cell division cycle 7-related protein kinase [Holothuria leucospilota]|uniref:non-specific serine/threonine protein kinase n=1 Tax=Holothuria leucospilota TaxID=206669 RepID=A0A9Q1C3E1_HOLLE|nr:Cell division cycle 7-related protein kinase [Holothuria leucospilota]
MESGKTASSHTDELHFISGNVGSGEQDTLAQNRKKSDLAKVKSPKTPQSAQLHEVGRLLKAVPQLDEIFRIVGKVGEGTFSSVFLARLKDSLKPSDDRQFVIKHIIPTSHPNRILTELTCLQQIGGKDNVMGVNLCLRKEDHVVMVMPYFHHDKFQNYIHRMKVDETREYMKNLFLALRRVHRFNIIHRDVKPSNFLYNRRGRRYALVDFGLAQKVTSPKRITRNLSAQEKQVKLVKEQKSLQPLKRKLANPSGQQLTELNINTYQNQVPSTKVPSHPTDATSDIENTPAAKRARLLSPMKGDGSEKTSGHKTPLKIKSQSRSSPLGRKCVCFGRPQVCDLCMSRPNQTAPRAGTPGFRAPEVLLKCEHQTTAVDMWSAGVILLSILSGRYPFFKVPDDLTGLAQIMNIHGSEDTIAAAKALGKTVISNVKLPAMDIQQLCQKLRRMQNSSTLPLGKTAKNTVRRKKLKTALTQRSPQNQPKHLDKEDQTEKRTAKEQFPDSAYNLLKQLLELNPAKRITAESALLHPFITNLSPS